MTDAASGGLLVAAEGAPRVLTLNRPEVGNATDGPLRAGFLREAADRSFLHLVPLPTGG